MHFTGRGFVHFELIDPGERRDAWRSTTARRANSC